MYEVTVLDGSGRRTVIDFHALTLDDGSKAFGQPPDVLFRKMKLMNVPEIAVDMGSHQLLVCLGRFRAATARNPITGKLLQAEGNSAA